MKHLIALIACLQLFASCNGQEGVTQKSKSGLNGSVKKVTNYICPIKKYGEIPKDTTNYESRTTSTYDSLGNLMEEHSFYQYNNTITESLTRYSGIGKNRTFTQKYLSGIEDTTLKSYKYVWSDDYHFKIVPSKRVSESDFTMEYTLDKDFRIIQSVCKKGATIQILDEFKYVISSNKVIEKILKRTIEEGATDRIIHVVTISKEYDRYGNPTLTYIYDDPDKQKLGSMSFTIYEYYGEEATHTKTR
ncbi:MAG: hypothetical protein EOO20_05210 [Chryseobacterium sp.]|nr:MAG: hypothetical protein EOO20_05210 [Chryseobacterium sp.]